MEMLNLTTDIYAHTNPAFCAILFYEFTKHFCEDQFGKSAEIEKPPFPIYFLVYPILYTRKGYYSFQGTNKKTGFFAWLERHPEMRVDFSIEVRAGKPYVRKSLLFAVSYKLLKTDGWYYWPEENPPLKKISWKVKTDERGQMLSNARSLGSWMGKVDIPTIFKSLGVSP